MKQLIQDFPKHIEEAFSIAEKSTFKSPTAEIHNIIICGMGGSGIGAKIVSNWVSKIDRIVTRKQYLDHIK